jgi:NADH:ubiquinone oxidoreductase subunit 6 (subunit J)
LVYVGAVVVLILFGIMLTPQRVEVPMTGGAGQRVSAVVLAGLVLATATGSLLLSPWPRSVAEPSNTPTTEAIGRALFTTFALPFEVASVLLAVAMIGAIVIARED